MSYKLKTINLLELKKKEKTCPNIAIKSQIPSIYTREKSLLTSNNNTRVNNRMESPKILELKKLKTIIKSVNVNNSSKCKSNINPINNNKSILQVKNKNEFIDIFKVYKHKSSKDENVNLKVIGNTVQKLIKTGMNKSKLYERQISVDGITKIKSNNNSNNVQIPIKINSLEKTIRTKTLENVYNINSLRKHETTNYSVDCNNEIYYTEQKIKNLETDMDMDLEVDENEYNTVSIGKQNLIKLHPKDTPNFNNIKPPNCILQYTTTSTSSRVKSPQSQSQSQSQSRTQYQSQSQSLFFNINHLLNFYSRNGGYKLLFQILLFLDNQDLKSLFNSSKRVRLLISNIIYEKSHKFIKKIKSAMNNNFQFLKRKILFSIVKSINHLKFR